MKRFLIFLLAMVLLLTPALAACEEEKKKSSKRDNDDEEDEEVLQDDEDGESSSPLDWFVSDDSQDEGSQTPEESETVSVEVSDEVSDEVSHEESQGGQEESEDPTPTFPLEEMYFNGTEICILTRGNQYASQFAGTEEFASTVVDAAVQERSAFIKEKYGIVITTHVSNRPANDIADSIISGSEFYHVVSDAVYFMVQHTTDGYFYDLNEILDLSQPWWDQSAINQLHLSDEVFFVAGNAIITDDLYTAGVLFNKEAYADYFEPVYGSLYDLVGEGKWTIDVMAEMAKAYSQPDGSGNWMTDGAYYGIVTDGYTGATMLTYGAGATTAQKQGDLEISVDIAESSVRAFDKVYALLTDTTASVYAEQFRPTNYAYASNMFQSGHALFQVAYLSNLQSLGEYGLPSECTPGIVPVPKYSPAQESYCSGVNVYQSDVLAIPVCNMTNLDATAYALELLGYYNSTQEAIFDTGNVCLAFYVDALRCQSAMDYNDLIMLDLISNSRIYDIGAAFNWGGNLIGMYSSNLFIGSNLLVSNWTSKLWDIEAALASTLEAYTNNYS